MTSPPGQANCAPEEFDSLKIKVEPVCVVMVCVFLPRCVSTGPVVVRLAEMVN